MTGQTSTTGTDGDSRNMEDDRMVRPLISLCIPTFNRPAMLRELLQSVATQSETDFEIVIRENASPQQAAIRAVVDEFRRSHPDRTVRYAENEHNIGYDGNVRALIETAAGSYCMFMADDDVLLPGAVSTVASALRMYPETQVVLRSYATVGGDGRQVAHRYFPDARYFPPGAESIVTFFRRSIVISGLTLHRDNSASLRTNRFDGTLLYQLYLVGMLISRGTGLFLPEVLALVKTGGVPFFGSSPSEPNYTPGEATPEGVTEFIRGILVIGACIEQQTGMKVRRAILRDLGNYSYPTLRIQAHRSRRVYLAYIASIMRLGLWTNPVAWVYALMLTTLGPSRCDWLIERIQTRAKGTPRIGHFTAGRSVSETPEHNGSPETEARNGSPQ